MASPNTLFLFLEEHRATLAALVGLGSVLFLLDETVHTPKASRSCSPIRMLRIVSLVVVLLISINQALLLPLEHIPQDLSGKTYLVTGCTPGGIGYETARTLMNWNASTVVCTMRSAVKAEALRASMVGTGPGKFDVVVAELASLDSVRQAGEELKKRFGKFDGIILNAGLMSSKRQITKDGFEEMYQVNHLSQFLLVRLLQGRLNSEARLVFVSSSSYTPLGKLDREVYGQKPGGRQVFNEWMSQWAVYMDTKLMNILSANAFAKRLAAKKVRATSVCPGLVATGFQDRMPQNFLSFIIDLVVGVVGRNALQGAMRPLHLLTNKAHAETTGQYFDPYLPMPLSPQVTEDNADWLWNKSNELLGLSNE